MMKDKNKHLRSPFGMLLVLLFVFGCLLNGASSVLALEKPVPAASGRGLANEPRLVPELLASDDRGFHPVSPGEFNASVRLLQQRLSYLGYDCGSESGYFDELTLQALYAFEEANGFDREETVSEELWTILTGTGAAEPSDWNPTPYLFRVNLSTNVVTVYEKDEEGHFEVPVRAMLCSAGTTTPTGYYTMCYQAEWNELIHDSWGLYASQIIGNYLFHSVPYDAPAHDMVQVEEYNKLGTTASAGCIRMAAADVCWIFTHAVEYESPVQIGWYGFRDPLPRPAAIRLPAGEVNDWDPTDPSEDNAWNEAGPVITGVRDHILSVGDTAPNLIAGVRAYDTCGNDCTARLTISGEVNCEAAGVYEVTYSLTDALGRTASETAWIRVE